MCIFRFYSLAWLSSLETMVDKLPDHIKEYLDSRNGSSDFVDLFEIEPSNFDLKTELNKKEIVVANVILMNDDFLKSLGIENNIFGFYANQYLRLRVSLDRKSRAEFVTINKKGDFQENMEAVSQFTNLQDLKK